jgi:hypothetical protein
MSHWDLWVRQRLEIVDNITLFNGYNSLISQHRWEPRVTWWQRRRCTETLLCRLQICQPDAMSITLTPDKVPSYLLNSALYCSLADDDGPFEVPAACCKLSTNLKTSQDLQYLLQTLRFWGVDECPDDLTAYVMTYPRSNARALLDEFAAELSYAASSSAILAQPGANPLTIAYKGGDLSVVKFLEAHDYKCSNACQVACEANQLCCLKHARKKQHDWIAGMCEVAVRRGHIECLQYAVENGGAWKVSSATAQLIGRLWDNSFAPQHRTEGHGLCCKDYPCSERHLECLKYAHDHGHYWGTVILVAAAECGHLSCMKYARSVNCAWTPDVANACARHGHLDCLEYCVENGCPLNATEALCHAAEGGHVHCVPYLLKNGARWPLTCVTLAAAGGHLNFVVYAVQHGALILCAAARSAAAQGNLPLLLFLVEHGCRVNELTYRAAANAKHWHCCDYLLNKGCSRPWSLLWDAVLRGVAMMS